jgi:hypothetical protein
MNEREEMPMASKVTKDELQELLAEAVSRLNSLVADQPTRWLDQAFIERCERALETD